MLHPVFFLIGTRKLMLLDNVVHVVFDGSTSDNSVLGFAVHGLRIYIKVFLLILNKPSFITKLCEIFKGFVIYLLRMHVYICRQVDLRLDDMQQ